MNASFSDLISSGIEAFARFHAYEADRRREEQRRYDLSVWLDANPDRRERILELENRIEGEKRAFEGAVPSSRFRHVRVVRRKRKKDLWVPNTNFSGPQAGIPPLMRKHERYEWNIFGK